jgi:hypothetical protein
VIDGWENIFSLEQVKAAAGIGRDH